MEGKYIVDIRVEISHQTEYPTTTRRMTALRFPVLRWAPTVT